MPRESQSVYTVAKKAGCSPSTVSRVLTNSTRVNPETRSRVLSVMREMKFITRKRVPQIGVLVSNLSGAQLTSYVSQLLRLSMLELVRRNCVIRLLNGEMDDWGQDGNFDAIVSLAYDESVNRLMAKYPAPVISLNNPLARRKIYDIHSDHRQSARIATEYLLSMGHRDIMMICHKRVVGSIGDWGMLERTAAFRETLGRHALRDDRIAYTDCEPVENILLRARADGVTALVVFSENEMRIPYLLGHVMKVRIPEEMSVIMEDLPGVLDLGIPPITAVRQPFERMVAEIMSRLDRILSGEQVSSKPVVFENELVIRGSVARIGDAVRPVNA